MRKLLFLSLVSCFIALSGTAFAKAQGNFYFPGAVDGDDSALVPMTAPTAQNNGFMLGQYVNKAGRGYISGQVGYANLHYKKDLIAGDYGTDEFSFHDFTTVGKVNSDGFAGRIGGGYYLSQYFAVEMGFVALPRVSYKDIVDHSVYNNIDNPSASYRFSFFQGIGEFLVRGEIPLKGGFYIFGKTGIAGVYRSNIKIDGFDINYDIEDDDFAFALGGGAGINISNHVSVDATYMHYFGNNDDLPGIDYIAGGINYLF